jgi:hypothetical protein
MSRSEIKIYHFFSRSAGVDEDEVALPQRSRGITRDLGLFRRGEFLFGIDAVFLEGIFGVGYGRAAAHLDELAHIRERAEVAPDGGFRAVELLDQLAERNGAALTQRLKYQSVTFFSKHIYHTSFDLF